MNTSDTQPKHVTLKTLILTSFISIVGASGLTLSVLFMTGLLPLNDTSYQMQQATTVPRTTNYALTANTIPVTSQEDLIIKTVEKANPAVVSIIISKDVPRLERYYEDYGYFSFPRYRENGTQKQDIGGGSGFIVSADGYVVTNKHVANDDDAEYTVIMQNGNKYTAQIIAKDPLNDISVLKIDAEKDLPYLTFADSDNLKIGQSVIAIGTPLEFSNSVSVGVISGLSRSIVAGGGNLGYEEQLDEVIQTDAAINPGNSGGPLLNLQGEVVGVNVAVANAENIGFSLPSNMVKTVFESVQEHGKIIRPFLGIRYIPVTEELKEENQLSVDYGVLILRGENPEELAVIPGSPADKADIVEGDIILEIDGEKLTGDKHLAQILAKKEVGENVTLKILHKGEEREAEVTLKNMENI